MAGNTNVAKRESPVIFHHKTIWNGVELNHTKVLPSKMEETICSRHELNIPLQGTLVTERQTASGNKRISCGTATGGNVCLLPAGQPMTAYWQEEIECLYLFLDHLLITNAAENLKLSRNIHLVETYQKQDPLIVQLCLSLLAESRSNESQGRLYAESLVQTLAIHLVRYYSTSNEVPELIKIGGLSGRKLRLVKEYIVEHLEEEVSLNEIAESAQLSPYHFARAFKRTTGLTPQQYLTQCRIEHAKELLSKGDLPLVEVGFRSGFKNQSHFTTLFRKFTTMTPKVWRELNIG